MLSALLTQFNLELHLRTTSLTQTAFNVSHSGKIIIEQGEGRIAKRGIY